MDHVYDAPAAGGNGLFSMGRFDGLHAEGRGLISELILRAGTGAASLFSAYTPGVPVLTTEAEKALVLEGSGLLRLASFEVDGDKELNEAAGRLRAGAGNIPFGRVPARTERESEAIKALLGAGELRRANEALGYAYFLRGIIVHGKAVGRNMGTPTANLLVPADKFLPKFGVYATVSEINGTFYAGVTNIGPRPSVDDCPVPTVETLLLDFDEDIYGETAIVRLLAYLRGVVKFESLEDLAAQIERDKNGARAVLGPEMPFRREIVQWQN